MPENRAISPGVSTCMIEMIRYGNHGTVTSRFPFSTAWMTASATRGGWITNRPSSRLFRTPFCGKPSVSTKPGSTAWTAIPLPRRAAASEREKASCACFAAAYAPAGANAVVPATETRLTTCAPAPDATAASSPGISARVHQTPPR